MITIVWAGIALIDPDAPPKSDWAVCIQGNQIVETGSRPDLLVRYPDALRVGGNQLLLMPAMVNSHDHGRGLGAATLGVPDDLLEIWLVKLASQPSLDPYLAAAIDGIHLLRSGVGTVAHSHNPRNWQNLKAEAAATL